MIAGSLAWPSALALARGSGWDDRFDRVLVDVCAAVLLPCAGWLWLVTSVTVVDVLRDRTRSAGATRRLVLLACGVAVMAGIAAPASADATGDETRLAGLPLPDRAAASFQAHGAAPTAKPPPTPVTALDAPARVRVRVRSGDSLWSIARDSAPPGTDARAIDARWRAIWAANRSVVGDDPDLIFPGQFLTLPAPTTGP